ncbi:MAG: hypothetical protein HYU81_00580 [Candidatus Brennerbacteria bacterium]|nr:hypothetical protein [Candidatus Brennerbacteria bacterium]
MIFCFGRRLRRLVEPPGGGLPIAFQLMAPHFRETDLFTLGKRYDEAYRK